MIRYFISLSIFALLGTAAHADVATIHCSDKGVTALEFTLNMRTHTISFSDITAFENAQMLVNTAFAYKQDEFYAKQAKNINFEYDWYYTAQYELELSKTFWELKNGDKVDVTFSGNDDDGSEFVGQQYKDCIASDVH